MSTEAAPSEVLPRLEVRHLATAPDHGVYDVSFTAEAATITALVDPRGRSAFETLHALHGDVPTMTGSVRISGRRVTHPGSALPMLDIVRDVDPEMTVDDYLERLARDRGTPRQTMAAAAEAHGVHRGARPLRALSPMEKKRLATVTSASCSADVLLADGPSQHSDPAARIWTRDLLRECARLGVAVVIAENDLRTAQDIAETIALISAGRVIAQGSWDEIQDQVLIGLGARPTSGPRDGSPR